MKTLLAISLASLAAGCTPAAPVEMTAAEQSALDAALHGRTAGATISCVSQRDLGGNKSIGEGAILFSGDRKTAYLNRPPAGCPELNSSRALVTKTTSNQLCRGDIATVIDPVSGIQYGSCALGDFTPYRRSN